MSGVDLLQSLQSITILDIIDILVVSTIIYHVIVLIKGTRGMQIAKGLLFLVSVLIICRFLNLRTVRWLVQTALYGIVVALPIVFQPELRRMLVSIGSGSGITNALKRVTEMTNHIQSVDSLMLAIEQLCDTKTGALIVIERQTGLDDYCETGTILNADISAKLLYSIFNTKAPLHDGAVVLRDFRITAASCYLPLSENVVNKSGTGKKGYGTRHRAAIGLSEQTDAVIIVVSEERGVPSIAYNGKIAIASLETIRRLLQNLCQNPRYSLALDTDLSEELYGHSEVVKAKFRSKDT